ncbi:hypothetical protein BDQ12DRAFT_672069 [Crucibulum laeve]|uniref:Uncharacterized protein n=1 Tax=Crucibulum laeve TaxID=68775 RepID=A0A5C3LEJ2_9AGAR|nr:hypothetical protein BDQ12DRAFT_672069 [Crucibulum laeve]
MEMDVETKDRSKLHPPTRNPPSDANFSQPCPVHYIDLRGGLSEQRLRIGGKLKNVGRTGKADDILSSSVKRKHVDVRLFKGAVREEHDVERRRRRADGHRTRKKSVVGGIAEGRAHRTRDERRPTGRGRWLASEKKTYLQRNLQTQPDSLYDVRFYSQSWEI